MLTQICPRARDGRAFRCSKCKSEKSIRVGSFLVDCRLALDIFASLVYLLQTDMSFKFIAELLDLRADTVGDYALNLFEGRSTERI